MCCNAIAAACRSTPAQAWKPFKCTLRPGPYWQGLDITLMGPVPAIPTAPCGCCINCALGEFTGKPDFQRHVCGFLQVPANAALYFSTAVLGANAVMTSANTSCCFISTSWIATGDTTGITCCMLINIGHLQWQRVAFTHSLQDSTTLSK